MQITFSLDASNRRGKAEKAIMGPREETTEKHIKIFFSPVELDFFVFHCASKKLFFRLCRSGTEEKIISASFSVLLPASAALPRQFIYSTFGWGLGKQRA